MPCGKYRELPRDQALLLVRIPLTVGILGKKNKREKKHSARKHPTAEWTFLIE